jgi:hyperosmotically inducible protein
MFLEAQKRGGRMSISRYLVTGFFCLTLLTDLIGAQSPAQKAPEASQNEALRISKQVWKSIYTLPEYGVFDAIHFSLKGKTVTLMGEASRPTLKSSAENVIKKVEGVENVVNQIGVLPLSNNDDRVRAGVYTRIYSNIALQKYTANRGGRWLSLTRRTFGITNDPPTGWHAIHIIVKNGNVTLKGVVDNSNDAAIAGIQANTTPGVFSVDNDLQVAKEEK